MLGFYNDLRKIAHINHKSELYDALIMKWPDEPWFKKRIDQWQTYLKDSEMADQWDPFEIINVFHSNDQLLCHCIVHCDASNGEACFLIPWAFLSVPLQSRNADGT